MTEDERPGLAIGHVSIAVNDVAEAVEIFTWQGMRLIHQSERYAVLELRGGTHVVARQADQPIEPGTPAPFDLMVDDVAAAHRAHVAKGLEISEIEHGNIHHWFDVTGPSGYRVRLTSSHAGTRPV